MKNKTTLVFLVLIGFSLGGVFSLEEQYGLPTLIKSIFLIVATTLVFHISRSLGNWAYLIAATCYFLLIATLSFFAL